MEIYVPHGGTTKQRNKGAYRGKLTCPVCDSEAIRYVENVTKFRIRYRCRPHGHTFQYDISNAPAGFDGGKHPYAPFTKNKWRYIVDEWNKRQREQKRR